MIKNNQNKKFINSLRKKLLDLSKRNNLINYTFGASRVRPNLRIIDEIPDLVYKKIQEQKEKLIFLNPVPNPEPLKFLDEQSADFIKAFRKNKDSSQEYNEFKKKNSSKPNRKELERIENSLKDLTRSQLGMSTVSRVVIMDEVLECKKRGINPSYYLSLSESSEFKHNDKNLQTLMFDKDLDLQLSRIYSRAKLSESELGINTLFICFGFLEWYDSENSKESLISPILTMPVQLLTEMSEGVRFYGLKGMEEDPSINLSLKEKLKSDFNIDLPSFYDFLDTVSDDGKITDTIFPIEKYLNEVSNLISKQKDWAVLPQLNLSILSFQKIALYQDLENYENKDPIDLVSSLMENKSTLQDFPEEYNLEDPEMQKKLPVLVSDADSSQVSAIIDASDGQNMIIEGPPGTGKSQTITNMIADLMIKNKKVLFVAEKRTALQVVKNRLDRVGLGNFCLELHSNKIRRSEIVDSIKFSLRERDSIESSDKIFKSITKREQEIRLKINEYLKLVSQPTSLDQETVIRDLIGQFVKLKDENENVLENIKLLIKPQEFSQKTRKDLYYIDGALKNLKTLLDSLSLNKFIDHPLYKISRAEDFNLTESKRQADELISILEKIDLYLKNIKELTVLNNFSLMEFSKVVEKFSNLPDLTAINHNLLIKYEANVKTLENHISEVHRIQNKFEKIKTIFPNIDYSQISNQELGKITNVVINSLKEVNFESSLYDLFSLAENYKSSIGYLKSADPDLKYILSNTFGYTDELSIADLKTVIFSFNQIKDISLSHLSIRNDSVLDELFPLFFDKVLDRYEDFLIQKEKVETITGSLSLIPSLLEMKDINLYLKNANIFQRIFPSFFKTKNKIADLLSTKKISLTSVREASEMFLKYRQLEQDLLDLKFIEDTTNDSLKKIKNTKEFLDILMEINSNLSNKVLSKKIKEKIKEISFSEITSIKSFIKEFFINLTTKFLTYTNEGLIKDEVLRLDQFVKKVEKFKVLASSLNISKSSTLNVFINIKEDLSFIRLLEIQLGSFLKDFELNQFNIINNPLSDAKNILTTIKNIHSLEFSPFFRNIIFNKHFILNSSILVKNQCTEISLLLKNLFELSDNFLGNFNKEKNLQINLEQLLEFIKYEKDVSILSKINKEISEMDAQPINLNNFCEFLLKNNIGKDLVKFLWIYSTIESSFSEVNNEYIYGDFLNNLRTEYRDLDSQKLLINAKIVKEFLNKKQLPKSINKSAKVAQKTGVDLINHLISKPLSRVSVRDLIQKSGKELQTLMPCFMMSPLSVAQFLPQESLFDVLIIDEASQIKLEDILSSVARTKQIIVVGDNKQLPPTSFFQTEEEVDDQDEDFNYESILDMSEKAFDKKRRLKWHYRSQHEDLIKFSNIYFYDNDLILFPSTHSKEKDVGVVAVKVNGVFENRKNREEANQIVDSAIDFIKNNPESSLALVAINKEQTTLIEDIFYEKSKGDILVDEYLQKWEKRQEDFIIKNLENIQGDERDAIFISMVYGEDSAGNFYNRFGPINSQKGHRRLNVLFSRAKKIMKVFYSIPEEKIIIDEERSSKGVKCLKNFIRFLNSGEILGRTYSSPNNWTPEVSVFEEAVREKLEKLGYKVHSQVGESGYFIDLVIENKKTGEYILAIECDGATYHSSKFMRDRDKTRQVILEKLGWKIHRIWSTDWFNDADREIRIIQDLIKDNYGAF